MATSLVGVKLLNHSLVRHKIQQFPLSPREFQILCRQHSVPPGQYVGRLRSTYRSQHRSYLSTTSATLSGAEHQRKDSSVPMQRSKAASSDLPTENLANSVKRLMRHVPHPVAVITATDMSVTLDGGAQGWRGATVSSFNTVALSPDPIVSFNIRKLSSTFDAMRSSGLFNVHLLSEALGSTDIASRFASGNASSPFHTEEGEIEDFAHLTDPIRTAVSSSLPPILQSWDEKGQLMVPFRLYCRYLSDKTVEIGDHVVLFGKVLQVFHDDNAFHDQAAAVPKPCLVYVNGRYSRVDSRGHHVPFVQRRKMMTALT